MRELFRRWFGHKWQPGIDPNLAECYRAVFSTIHGQQLLMHWMDTVYCQVYQGSDPILLANHNGRRSLLHEILQNIDHAEHPAKYRILADVGADNGLGRRDLP